VGDRPLVTGAIVAGNVGRQFHRHKIEFSAHIGGSAQRERARMVKGEILDAVGGRELDAAVYPADKIRRRWEQAVAAALGCFELLLW
jgi:hypothetical protein